MNIGPIGPIGLILFLSLAEAAAAPSLRPFGPETPVTAADHAPHPMGNEHYGESWSHGVWDRAGRFVLGIDFVVSNLGLGDHKGYVRMEHQDPSGRRLRCSSEYGRNGWAALPDGAGLRFGDSSLVRTEAGWRLSARCEGLAAELDLIPRAPAAKPGGGVMRFPDGLYGLVFSIPRAEVAGTLSVKGDRREISGIGHADHSWGSMAPYEQARLWFRFKSVDSRATIVLTGMEAADRFGREKAGWALLYDDAGRAALVSDLTVELLEAEPDPKQPKYLIPQRVRISGRDREAALSGELTMTGLREVRDPLADLNPVTRSIVRSKMKARDFYLDCRYDLTLERDGHSRRFTGSGFYRIQYINP